jgi:hypothetical protein
MTKRTVPALFLDDGNIPPLIGESDVEHLVWLLEVCRQRGYRLGPTVQVGSVIAHVADLRIGAREGLDTAGPPPGSVWKEHGHDPDRDVPVEGTTGR